MEGFDYVPAKAAIELLTIKQIKAYLPRLVQNAS